MNKQCQRCQKEFTCNATSILQCDCSKIILSKETQTYIAKKYEHCLCLSCLNELNSLNNFSSLTNNLK